MLRRVTPLMLLLSVGCVCNPDIEFQVPGSDWDGQPWDTRYLLEMNPADVSVADLTSSVRAMEAHYEEYAEVHGVCWQPIPALETGELDAYGSGGDSLLFTGYALAQRVFKYRVTKRQDDLRRLVSSLSGLHLLTNVTGTPGVMVRCAFPKDAADAFSYPESWQHRIEGGFVGESPNKIRNPRTAEPYPPMIYYSRATKDQLTGLVFGLSALWALCDDPAVVPAEHRVTISRARELAARITRDVVGHLRKYDWKIRDHRGRNDTSADYVDGLLRSMVLALRWKTATLVDPELAPSIGREYLSELAAFLDLSNTLALADRFNSYDGYYAYNLRTARAFAIWMLDAHLERRGLLTDYFNRNIWRFVEDHQCAWFTLVHNIVNHADADELEDALWSLKSLSLKPTTLWPSPYVGQEHKPPLSAVAARCTGAYVVAPHLRKPTAYFDWQKEPWDVGKLPPSLSSNPGATTGLGLTMPYWLGRLYGLVPSR